MSRVLYSVSLCGIWRVLNTIVNMNNQSLLWIIALDKANYSLASINRSEEKDKEDLTLECADPPTASFWSGDEQSKLCH